MSQQTANLCLVGSTPTRCSKKPHTLPASAYLLNEYTKWTEKFRWCFEHKSLSRYPKRWHSRIFISRYAFFGCFQAKDFIGKERS